MVNPDPHPEPTPTVVVAESLNLKDEPFELEPLSPLTDDGEGVEDLIMSTTLLKKSRKRDPSLKPSHTTYYDNEGNVSAPKVFGSTPLCGLKLSMSHQFKETWDHRVMPRLKQLPDLLPMCLRYVIYRIFIWFKGREPFIDMFTVKAQQIYGTRNLL